MYEKEHLSFSYSPVKFQSGVMRFSGEKSVGAGAVQKISFHPCPSIERHSKQRTPNLQNRSKY